MTLTICSLILALAASASAQTAMWGGSPGRNQVSDEQNLPTTWDVETGTNVKWSATLGSQTYAGPLIAGDKIFVGTNNQAERDPNHKGDRGVVMAFSLEDGAFLWQIAHPKLPAGRVNDWPQQGVCSTPYVEGDRLYYVSNRAGSRMPRHRGLPRRRERRPHRRRDCHRTHQRGPHLEIRHDRRVGRLPPQPRHQLAHRRGRPALRPNQQRRGRGPHHIPAPFAPSFIALDLQTGDLLWDSDLPGDQILHGQWANPAYGEAGGRKQVIFPGGDGWVYALAPDPANSSGNSTATPRIRCGNWAAAAPATTSSPRPSSTTA